MFIFAIESKKYKEKICDNFKDKTSQFDKTSTRNKILLSTDKITARNCNLILHCKLLEVCKH